MGAISCNGVIRSWWFLVLAYLIDSGDGQRGMENLDQLRRDSKILHQLTDNIQHDMKLFHDQEEIFRQDLQKYEAGDHTKKHHKKWIKKHRHHNIAPTNYAEHIKFEIPTYLMKTLSLNSNHTNENFISDNTKISNSKLNINNKENENAIYWPKFDDILRLANSKYDWKNDRWIKLRNISNEEDKKHILNNVLNKYSKPRFKYSRVRINGSNSKKNIVIAISAMPKAN